MERGAEITDPSGPAPPMDAARRQESQSPGMAEGAQERPPGAVPAGNPAKTLRNLAIKAWHRRPFSGAEVLATGSRSSRPAPPSAADGRRKAAEIARSRDGGRGAGTPPRAAPAGNPAKTPRNLAVKTCPTDPSPVAKVLATGSRGSGPARPSAADGRRKAAGIAKSRDGGRSPGTPHGLPPRGTSQKRSGILP